MPTIGRRRGRKPRVPLADLLPALLFHVMQGPGRWPSMRRALFDDTLADSSWADRRARLPWAIFADLLRRMLRPRATRRQRDAFWRGWRLVALDGTQFSLTNTPQITAATTKARTRRGRAAFAKLTTAVLLEVGLHNPLAAGHRAPRRIGMGAGATAAGAAARRALLLGDRLYGVAAFVGPARAACARVGSHFLLRAGRDDQATGASVAWPMAREWSTSPSARATDPAILEWLEVREIRVRVGRAGAPRRTSCGCGPACSTRAQPPRSTSRSSMPSAGNTSCTFREVKRQLRKTDVLQSHTVETGAQEIAALVLASAVLAAERQRAAGASSRVAD